jgi:hypothetical protein
MLAANKDDVPPTPIIIPEQKDIKQNERICALVNFSTGFIHTPTKIFYSFLTNPYHYTPYFLKNQVKKQILSKKLYTESVENTQQKNL